MLQFSANLSLLFTEHGLVDRFKAAKDAGFSAVEIQFPYELSAERIKRQLQQNGLKLVLFNVDADTLLQGGEGLAAVPEKRSQFEKAVEQARIYAEILQPEAINILPGRCLTLDRYGEYLETFKNNLLYAAHRFGDIGVKTVFEAVNIHDMPAFIISSGQQMLDVLSELNHPGLAMQYDLYHMLMMRENCSDFLTCHLDKIGHIQFADCPGRNQPGTGKSDLEPLFRIIAASGYRGWTGAEYRPTGKTVDSLDWFSTDRTGGV